MCKRLKERLLILIRCGKLNFKQSANGDWENWKTINKGIAYDVLNEMDIKSIDVSTADISFTLYFYDKNSLNMLEISDIPQDNIAHSSVFKDIYLEILQYSEKYKKKKKRLIKNERNS